MNVVVTVLDNQDRGGPGNLFFYAILVRGCNKELQSEIRCEGEQLISAHGVNSIESFVKDQYRKMDSFSVV